MGFNWFSSDSPVVLAKFVQVYGFEQGTITGDGDTSALVAEFAARYPDADFSDLPSTYTALGDFVDTNPSNPDLSAL